MTKKTLVVGLLAMFSVTTFAQTAAKKDKKTYVHNQTSITFRMDSRQVHSSFSQHLHSQVVFSSLTTKRSTNGVRCSATLLVVISCS